MRFVPLDLASGDAPIAIDESIVVRFTRPLADAAPSPRAVILHDDQGATLEAAISVEGRSLIIRPASPLGAWPLSTTHLDLTLPHPVIGAGIRSIDGDSSGAAFHQRIRKSNERIRHAGALTLVESFPLDGQADIDFVSDPNRQFNVRLTFDAPLDPSSLEAGIQIVDTRRGEVVEGVTRRLDPADPRRVAVEPFAGGILFSGRTKYDVILTSSLRATDGRTLISREKTSFTTRDAPDNQRIIKVQFEGPSDVEPASVPQLDPATRSLRPRQLYQPLRTPGSTTRQRSILDDLDASLPHPFSGPEAPSRTQILIPVEWLHQSGSDEHVARSFIITAVDFVTPSEIPADSMARDLQVTLGHLSRASVAAGKGLDEVFDRNDENGRLARLMPLRNAERVVHLVPQSRSGGGARARASGIHLEFAEPYVCDLSEGDLVLGIRNLGGVVSEQPPQLQNGIEIAGFLADDGMSWLVTGSSGDATGRKTGFRPYLNLTTFQIPPIVTRWYTVQDALHPKFFRDPNRLRVKGEAREGEDFKVYYQGGKITPGTGARAIQATSNFTDFPPTDGACDSVRLRIEYDPRLLLKAWPDGLLPRIEYIPLGYTGAVAGPSTSPRKQK